MIMSINQEASRRSGSRRQRVCVRQQSLAPDDASIGVDGECV